MELRYNELRLDNELTQDEVAKILKVKRSAYSKWELGIIHYIVEDNLDIDWNKLSERLIELRKSNNYTQEYLSKKLGFPQRTYSNYETGTRRPTTFKLLSVAQFFNVSMDYLTGRVDNKNIK